MIIDVNNKKLIMTTTTSKIKSREFDNDSQCEVIKFTNNCVVTISDEYILLHDNDNHIYSEIEPIMTIKL